MGSALKVPPARLRWGLDERLVLWLLLNVAGYAWVNAVQCGRGSLFLGRSGDYVQLVRLMAVAPVLYFLGPRWVLRSWRAEGTAALRWNGLGYVLPFCVGLQFFYLQRIDAINYSLNYHDLSRMGWVGMVVFSGAGCLILGLAWWHVRQAYRAGIGGWYVGAFVGAVLGIALVAYLWRDTRHIHIHHWFLFCFFIPFTRFRHPVSLVSQAICAAIYIEGVAEWSMATIWELN